MKSSLITCLVLCTGILGARAQSGFTYEEKQLRQPLWQSGNFGENSSDIIQFGGEEPAPLPAGDYGLAKYKVNKAREASGSALRKTLGYQTTPADLLPDIDTSFDGMVFGSRGIPNDNHLAVSNDGVVVSVQNSSIRVFDATGNSLMYKSLYGFANGKVQGLTNYCYDPKVMYDPDSDRFILFFLHESKVASNFGILAFSKTKDPAGDWNFYKVPGNAIKNDKWSDYPIMAITREDVFITLNLLTENSDWRDGFNQSIIWQIEKSGGYRGDTLNQKVYYDIRFKGKAIWSICPVQGGFKPTHPAIHFLSVRPGDSENDTVFLHTIGQTLRSNLARLELKVYRAGKKYGVPPVAPQPAGYDSLQTNDARVLGAMVHNGKIQYVQTTLIKPAYRSGIFHGWLDLNSHANITATYIQSDTMDFAYPSIAYAGTGADNDHASVITFSHVSSKSYPGTSAIFHTRTGTLPSLFSEVLMVKKGVKGIERLPFSQYPHERWGDYTGIQYQYNAPGTLWLAGSFGNTAAQNGTWISKLIVKNKIELVTDGVPDVYPNPVSGRTTVGFYLNGSNTVQVAVYSTTGQLVAELFNGGLPTGYHEFYLSGTELSPGVYHLRILSNDKKVHYVAKLLR